MEQGRQEEEEVITWLSQPGLLLWPPDPLAPLLNAIPPNAPPHTPLPLMPCCLFFIPSVHIRICSLGPAALM